MDLKGNGRVALPRPVQVLVFLTPILPLQKHLSDFRINELTDILRDSDGSPGLMFAFLPGVEASRALRFCDRSISVAQTIRSQRISLI